MLALITILRAHSLSLSLLLSVSFLLHPSNQQQFASEVSQSIELSMQTHHHPTCCTCFTFSSLLRHHYHYTFQYQVGE